MPFLLRCVNIYSLHQYNTSTTYRWRRLIGFGKPRLIRMGSFESHSNSTLPRIIPLQWRHNGRNGVSNHRRLYCLLNRLFRCKSKKHQSSASLAFLRGIYRSPVNSAHKGPVTRKMFPFDNVIIQMLTSCLIRLRSSRSRRSSSVLSFRSFRFRDIIFRSFRSKASTLSRWAATSPLNSASGIVWSFCRSHKAA